MLRSLCLFLALIAFLPARARGDDSIPQARLDIASRFVDLLVSGDFATATGLFDANVKQALPEAKLREIWTGLNGKAGPFQKRTGIRGEKSGDYDVIHVTCAFEKVAVDVKVVLDKEGLIAGLFFAPAEGAPKTEWAAPDYVTASSFHEEDVMVAPGEWALPGTLTLPAGKGPFPALVLVHGSGPHDRDETIGPNKPFRDLAWGLASRGVAVLRYEKRTKVHGARMAGLKSLTVKEETVDDAVSAAALLRTRPDIDPKRVFVLGHSLGGTVIPRIAARDAALAGVIVMAGPARPLEDVALEQLDYVASLGTATDDEKKQLEEVKTQLTRVKTNPAGFDSTETIMGAPIAYWLDLHAYRPADMARTLPQPFLILQGERDYQVSSADFQIWKDALGGRKDVTFVSWPDLNHLFMTGTGKATPSEYEKPGHVDRAVIERISTWIARPAPR